MKTIAMYNRHIIRVLFFLVLVLAGCKEDTPVDDDKKIIISKDVVVINDQTWKECFVKMDSANYTLTFTDKSDMINKMVPENIIISGVGKGLMRRVVTIRPTVGQVVFITKPTVLTEVIQQGLIHYEQALTPQQIKSVTAYQSGEPINPENFKSSKGDEMLGFPITWSFHNNEVSLTTDFDCSLSLDANIEIGWDGLEEVKLGFRVSEELSISFNSLIAFTDNDSYPREQTIWSLEFETITIWAGVVPLRFSPTLYIKVGYEGNTDRPFTTGYAQNFAYNAGIQWYDGNWSTYSEYTNNQQFIGPNTTNIPNANVKAYIKPEIEVMIDGLVGPFAFLKLYGKLSASPAPTNAYTIYKGVSLGAGVRVNVLSWNWEYQVDNILNYEDACIQAVSSSAQIAPNPSNLKMKRISSQNASVTWELNTLGNKPILSKGICWSTQQNPTVNDNKTDETIGAGSFISDLTNLTPDAKYYIRAYTTISGNSGPTSVYSPGISFVTTSGTFVDSRDNHLYNYINLGSQRWMAENLAFLPSVNPCSDIAPVTNMELPHFYVYDYNGNDVSNAKATINYSNYGALYNYGAAMAACPEGWRLPTDQDFKDLESFLGLTSNELTSTGFRGTIGNKLKAGYGWDGNGNSTDPNGFNATPAGYVIPDPGEPGFWYMGTMTYFWTSTSSTLPTTWKAWGRHLDKNNNGFSRNKYSKSAGYSVRCIKNE